MLRHSKNAVLLERLRHARAGAQRIPYFAFAVHLFPRLVDHLVGELLRYDDGTDHVGEDEIAGAHGNVSATYRALYLDDVHAAERVVGRQSATEGRESELHDFLVIPRAAVSHDAPRPPAQRRGGEQPSPGG